MMMVHKFGRPLPRKKISFDLHTVRSVKRSVRRIRTCSMKERHGHTILVSLLEGIFVAPNTVQMISRSMHMDVDMQEEGKTEGLVAAQHIHSESSRPETIWPKSLPYLGS